MCESKQTSITEIDNMDTLAEKDSILPLQLGLDNNNDPIELDLALLPHLLIAGIFNPETNLVIINLIKSLFSNVKPEKVQLLPIAGQRGRLRKVINELPHTIQPVYNNDDSPFAAIEWTEKEINKRYRLLAQNKVRRISEYNSLVRSKSEQQNLPPTEIEPSVPYEKLPYIVLVICDLTSITESKWDYFQDHIQEIAMISRAVGIHIIIVSSDPSPKYITNLILKSCPARLAFHVTEELHSQQLIHNLGATKLKPGKQMLFCNNSISKPFLIRAFPASVFALLRRDKMEDKSAG